jgi:hypothetical protein
MTDHIPSMDEIRSEYSYTDRYGGDYDIDLKARFDKALAEHERKIRFETWNEARAAKPDYSKGHYEDCMGWEHCHCDRYPNPYGPVE